MATRSLPVIILCIVSSLMLSCIREDLSGCVNGVRLYFDYRDPFFNGSLKEGIEPSNVQQLDLFVFDTDGYYVGRYTDDRPDLSKSYYMDIRGLESGVYRFVVWGGLNNDYILEEEPVIGQTNISDLLVQLGGISGGLKESPPGHLFHAGAADPIEVKKKTTDHTLWLGQLSYDISVVLISEVELQGDYRISISDDAALFDFGGQPLRHADFEYVAEFSAGDTGGEINALMRVLLLAEERSPQLKITSIQDARTIVEINLVEEILKLRQLGVTVDFSYMHEFELKFSVDEFFNFTLWINGWKVVEDQGPIG